MREYETIYILKSDLPGDIVSNIKDKVAGVLQKAKSHILCHADWGKRKLAYNLHKNRQGQYFYLQYLAKGPEVSEVERILKYDDHVLRFLTVQLNSEVNVEERLANPPAAPLPPEEFFHSAPSEQYYPRRGGSDQGGDDGVSNEPVENVDAEEASQA